MNRILTTALCGLLTLGGLACPGTGGGEAGSKEDAFAGGSLKADCFDCDPADLRSAFEQADLGRTGFYRRGTTWQVAHQFRIDRRFEKHVLGPDEVLLEGGLADAVLLDYRVDGLETRVFGDYKRPVARIRLTQAPEAGPFAGLVTAERLDRFEYQVDLLMNDLFEGVAKVHYNTRYPNGRYVELSEGSRVRSAMDAFPVDVPDVTVADRVMTTLPGLSPELEAVGAKAAELGWLPADWQTRDYRYYRFEIDGGVEEVYWARGDLWPSFVRTPRGDALLVRQLEP